MRRIELADDWEFCQRGGRADYYQPAVAHVEWLPAEVPGAIHLDLFRNGVVADPFSRLHEAGVRWVDDADWSYRCRFSIETNHSRQVLRFDGLDTVCRIELNGEQIAHHDNMFVPLEVDVTGKLLADNDLAVHFASPVKAGHERRQRYFAHEDLPYETPFFDERAFVRKAQYMSGWDWGPRFVSCGIWKPVTILDYDERVGRTSVMQERLADGSFRVWIEGDEGLGAEFSGEIRNPGEPLEFIVGAPQLWWPNGEGEAHLYDVRIFTSAGESVVKRIGLRTIGLIRDESGSFEFEVNGRRIFARGANWIPNDSFIARATDVREQIDRCRRLAMNMLRVWGGGVYESEEFYDACDEAGILVWQDFPYACSYYPDGPEELAAAEAEARTAVLRLRDRTCLALWCGNNENSAMWETSWGGSRPPSFYGSAIYEDVLPKVVSELDPQRDYIPTSPVIPNDESRSDSHYWDVWHGRGDWIHYTESKARFASEFGFASSCSLECWRSVLGAGDWDPHSTAVRWHDKTTKPLDAFEGYVLKHHPQWQNLEEWVYFSQLNQRDALRCAIEHYRRSDFCRGSLIWQFNDCWPVQSWAVQDYSRLLKPAGFELARLYAPVLLSISTSEEAASVWIVNDSPSSFSSRLTLDAISTLDGSNLASWTQAFTCEAGERKCVFKVDVRQYVASSTALRAEVDGAEPTWQLLSEPRETVLGSPEVALHENAITVKGFARDLVVWDPDDVRNVYDLATGEPGWKALTLANSELKIGLKRKPTRLLARSLGGSHDVVIS